MYLINNFSFLIYHKLDKGIFRCFDQRPLHDHSRADKHFQVEF